MEKSTLRQADLVFSVILIIFGIFVAINGILLMIEGASQPVIKWYSSPGLMPLLIGFFTLISAISLYRIARKDGASLDFINRENIKKLFAEKSTKNTLFIIGLIGIYIYILLQILPYAFATFIFLFAFIAFFKGNTKKELIIAVIISAVTTALLVYGFGSLAQIPLP